MIIDDYGDNLKITYLKNGNSVDQLSKILSNIDSRIENGPDAFIYDFIINNIGSDILILSRAKRKAKYHGRNIKAIVYDKGKSKSYQIFFRALSAMQMFFSILMHKPDKIICGCTGEQLWISFIVAMMCKVPLVHSRHNLIVKGKSGFVKTISYKIDEWVIRRLTGVVAHGPFLHDQIKKLGIKSRRVHEFDVGFEDTKNFFNQQNQLTGKSSLFDNCRYLLFVGRVEKNKGIFDLLIAAKPILIKNSDLKLLYVGDGTDINMLKLKVATVGLQKQVMILGKKERLATLKLIKSAYLLICPTTSSFPEGRCMVAMEGLVMGVPVVAPNFGPFPYLIKHEKNGLLYKPDSTGELANCIEQVILNNQKYQKLRIGAFNSGKSLVRPIRKFSQALDLAFEKYS